MDGKDESVYESFSDRLTPTSGCWENGARGQILEQKYTWPQRRLSQADVTAITSPKIEPAKVGIQRALSRSQNGCPEKHIDWARGGDGEWRLGSRIRVQIAFYAGSGDRQRLFGGGAACGSTRPAVLISISTFSFT
jgi:hypothetical protein